MKSVLVLSYSGPYFLAFGLNTERYSVSLRIRSECGKMWTKITSNTDAFYAVISWLLRNGIVVRVLNYQSIGPGYKN